MDNDWVTLIIRQLAWLIIRQWLSHTDYSWLINQLIKLIFHSSGHASSINQLAWLIIRLIDYSTMIRQWLFNQPARVIDYSTTIEPHWFFVINQPTHQIGYSFEFNQPARLIDYWTMIESHWLSASSPDWLFDNYWATLIIRD